MKKENVATELQAKYLGIEFCLNEMGRRLWAANEAKSYGRGGVALVSKALGMSNKTVGKGLKELSNLDKIDKTRTRKKGGGRKSLKEKYPDLVEALDALVEPTSRGDPMNPLRWTSKSVRNLEQELHNQGYKISYHTIGTLLKAMDYSLQSNKKTNEGSSHEDRDKQFHYINKTVTNALKKKQPSISVDTKKKENIGEFKNAGQEYASKGKPIKVNTHDFPDKELGKVAPYGIYDIGQNTGWVSVGISGDTAEFAVNAIRTWRHTIGKQRYSKAKEIVVIADCGGSNGYRVRLWKYELQKLANDIQCGIKVRHFPRGTSKWNKIEHRLFSYITKNWRGKPFISREVVVNLIGNTKTKTGLKVTAVLDENIYEKGKKVDDLIFNSLNVVGDKLHPEWNYSIKPQPQIV